MIAILRNLLPIHTTCKEHCDWNTSVVDTASILYPVSIEDRFDAWVNVSLNHVDYFHHL